MFSKIARWYVLRSTLITHNRNFKTKSTFAYYAKRYFVVALCTFHKTCNRRKNSNKIYYSVINCIRFWHVIFILTFQFSCWRTRSAIISLRSFWIEWLFSFLVSWLIGICQMSIWHLVVENFTTIREKYWASLSMQRYIFRGEHML